jgi:phosphoheptose isomerase
MSYGTLREHLVELRAALADVEQQSAQIECWGGELAQVLAAGRRLLVAGNGGSAAEAQHLTAELVGRFDQDHRRPLSAIALHADTSTLTALGNDYGYEHIYARQVQAHGRPGDVLILLSTSGRSPNLIAAARAARRLNLHVWSVTGPGPNPVTLASDQHITINAGTSAVQETHLVLIHALCAAVERHLPTSRPTPATGTVLPDDAIDVSHMIHLSAAVPR